MSGCFWFFAIPIYLLVKGLMPAVWFNGDPVTQDIASIIIAIIITAVLSFLGAIILANATKNDPPREDASHYR